MSNPTLTALTAYAGKYAPQLLGQLYRELNLNADGIRVIPGVKNKMIMPRVRIGRGLKPYTGVFASSDNQLKYSDRTLEVARAQRDLEIDPEKYRTTYLSQYIDATSGSNANKPAQIPFAQFMWGEYMKENAQEIVDLLYFGKGKDAFAAYNAGTAYAIGNLITFGVSINGATETQYFRALGTTTAGQTPLTHPAKWDRVDYLAIVKGFGAMLSDAITNEGFSQIANTGAITGTDAYNQFTAVWRLQSEQVKDSGAVVYCSRNSYELLMDSIETNVKKYFEQVDGISYLPKTDRKCIIKPVNWMAGSGRLICTPMNNLVVGTDQLSDLNTMTSIPKHYTLETSLSFLFGTQIADLDVVTINEVY